MDRTKFNEAKDETGQESGDFPDLDEYLEGRGRHLVNYSEGARLYRIPYYSFVRLAKEAEASYKLRKTAIADIGIVEEYLMKHPEIMERLDRVREV